MKTEVLRSIKQTEEEYRSTISAAEEERSHSIANAKLEAENLVKKARTDASEYVISRLADARAEAKRKHDEIVREGELKAIAVMEQSREKTTDAVELFVTRFKEHLNV
jgi:V/A-type H+-transporting ATPase subunit G/H